MTDALELIRVYLAADAAVSRAREDKQAAEARYSAAFTELRQAELALNGLECGLYLVDGEYVQVASSSWGPTERSIERPRLVAKD